LNPVIGASINAIVTDGTNDETIILVDNGIFPDTIKNDGIYSAYYNVPNVAGKSRYSLVCKIEGTEQTSVVNSTAMSKERSKSLPSHSSVSAPLCCGSVAVKDDTPISPTGVFTRSKSGGVITVQGDGQSNTYPPGPIRDLILTDLAENSTFTLSFTFSGDDLNTGTVQSFSIFYSNISSDLQGLDPNSPVDFITEEMLDCDCTLDPLPPFSEKFLWVNSSFFDPEKQYYFRVLVVDNGGKTSTSNLVAFTPSPFLFPVFGYGLGLTWGIAIAIFIGAMGGTLLIAGTVMWHKWYYGW